MSTTLRAAALLAATALAGCATQPAALPALSLRPVGFAQLPGWPARPAAILPALLHDCERMALLPQEQRLGGSALAAQLAGQAADWQSACSAARALPDDDVAARRFFETWFQPYAVGGGGAQSVRFTGYFEPEVAGATSRGGPYQTPLLAKPDDPVPGVSRSQIESGALAGHHLALLWLRSPVDLFFLQVQGSGRVRLPDGSVVRVGYAGTNGQPYVPIGKVLVARGALAPDDVSLQSIRNWLIAHPDQARAVMDANPDYVFFRVLPGLGVNEGPPGALGVDLTPRGSIAVDRHDVPLGSPVWVDTTEPDGAPLRGLMLAQDLGSNIKGPLREDVFFGWGPAAESVAGRMDQTGRAWLLLLRPPPTS